MSARVLAVTGLKREAACVEGPAILCLPSGADVAGLRDRMHALLTPDIEAIISIGIAGGLDPHLEVGDAVIATAVQGPSERHPVDLGWSRRLAEALGGARQGLIAGSDVMLASADVKAEVRRRTRALCVDMESHVAASVAAARRLPFAALRYVSDPADRALPPAAQVGMTVSGDMDVVAVLKALLADPRQLPALLRTGREAEMAFRALLRGSRRLGATLGFADV